MGNVKLTDTSIAKLKALPFKMRERALNRAVMAGAEIAQNGIEALAWETQERKKKKREFGPIKTHVIIYKRKREFLEKGDSLFALAGPSKDAFYSYFIEKGWKVPLGGYARYVIPRADKWHYAGHMYTTRRLRRFGGKEAHSQMGVSGYREIRGRHLVKDLVSSISGRIYEAMREVFRKAV